MSGRNEINKEFLVWNPVIGAVCKVIEDANLRLYVEKVNDSGYTVYKTISRVTLNHWETFDLDGNRPSDEEKLDCPYDFTSRCTLGRCDCEVKIG